MIGDVLDGDMPESGDSYDAFREAVDDFREAGVTIKDEELFIEALKRFFLECQRHYGNDEPMRVSIEMG